MEIARHWRLRRQRYRLEGSICPESGQVTFPPRPACPYDGVRPASITGSALSESPIATAISQFESLVSVPSIERTPR